MPIAVILDCGATNVRAIAINDKGDIVASHYTVNETLQEGTLHVWDFEQIWQKLIECCRAVTDKIYVQDIVGISVTTFGVDGAPFDKSGQQIYPIISWKCSRTAPVMESVSKELNREELYIANGIGDYSFNTLFKLKWLKDNEPEVYLSMDKWVFISSMINHRLTGELSTDRTMAGTSMMTNLETGDWDTNILDYLELTTQHFPKMVDAGEIIGVLKEEMASLLNLPTRTPVISSGHDTQFALFGAGVKESEVFLSSGTWEILMARSARPGLKSGDLDKGITTELDSKPGLYNPAIQWLSSAIVEWVANTYFLDVIGKENKYSVIVTEGEKAPIGCNGVTFDPSFLLDSNKLGHGEISGLSINTNRGEIYRAALEGLALKLALNFKTLSDSSGIEAHSLRVVGGGSKNRLWNQIRADVLGKSIHIVEQSESTVMGAAMFVFAGVNIFPSPEEAQLMMTPSYEVVTPGSNSVIYQELFRNKLSD